MSSLWERIGRWLGASDDAAAGAGAASSVDLVAGLRAAADDLHVVRGEIAQAGADRPNEDFTQARLLLAAASVLELIADGLTEDIVGAPGETTDDWRARHSAAIYRALLGLLDRARLAVARPPSDIAPIKVGAVLPSEQLALAADVAELLALNERLQQHYAADIAYARASRSGADQMRLNELLGVLRSRANLADTLPRAGATGGDRAAIGRAALGEILALWLLIAQELTLPDVTAELVLGPSASATGKYAPDNVWMMTDPVAKARYEAGGRLDELAQDIRLEVLRGRPFGADDIAFAQQLDWLEQNHVVERLASYWATSPHSPIYRAKEAGELKFATGRVAFGKADRIVWLCQMGKEMAGVALPALVGDLQSSRVRQLCGDMQNAMMGAKMKRQSGMNGMP